MCPKQLRYVRGFPRQNLNQLDPQTGKITQARPLLAPIGPSHRDFRMSVAEIGAIRVTEAAGYLCPPIDCTRELVRCIVQHTIQGRHARGTASGSQLDC